MPILLLISALTGLAMAEEPTAEPAPAPEPSPVTYTLDPAASWLYVVVYNDPSGIASAFGHDHGVRAMDFTGQVVWDPADPSACRIEIGFPVSSLTPDPSGMRERAGLDPEGAVGDDSLDTIKRNLQKRSQLDADSFPRIDYRSTGCSGGPEKFEVSGELTIRGVSKALSVPMTISATETSFTARGEFIANHTDFGFKPFTNLGGALKNKDGLRFVIDVVGKPAG